MVFACLKAGFSRVWANKRLILIFYLPNLFFAMILMLPFRAALSHYIGESLMGEKLGGQVDMDFLFEFIHNNPALSGNILTLGLLVLAVYFLFNLFLSGGAYAVFLGGQPYTAAQFWGSAGKYFGRFLRLFFWGLPLLALLFSLQFIVAGIQKIFWGDDPYEYILYWGSWIKLALRWLAFFLFFIVFDYARIYTVKFEERKMGKAFLEGLRFSGKNFRRTTILAFSFSLMGILALPVYNPVADLFSAPEGYIIALLFVWQQLFILFRMALRLGLYASQGQLYNHLGRQVKV